MTRAPFKALTLALPLLPIAIVALGIAWTVSASSAAPEQYASYRNDRWHFSLAVPSDMTVGEYDQPGGGQKIQFSDASADKIFEITTAPFTLLDVAIGAEGAPTSNSDQPTQLGIVRVIRDDTFNVSFVKSGVAYTITTMPQLETWLIELLRTWQFTN